MMQTGEKRGQPDWMLAVALAVLLAAMVAAPNVTTMNEGAYAAGLRILHNQPALPAEMLLNAVYHLPGIGSAKTGAAGVLAFLLDVPLMLAALSALAAFGGLRYLGFDRLESGAVSLLLLLAAPVYEAFMPGFLPPEALAVPLALAGILAIAYASSEKRQVREALASVVAAAAFALAVWVQPISALIPLGLLAGELLLARETHHKKERKANDVLWLKWGALALPILVLAVRLPDVPSLAAAMGAWAGLPSLAWPLLGLAAIGIPAGLRREAHPASRLVLPLILSAVLATVVSPAMALVALVLPAAYGLHTLRSLEEEAPIWRIAMLFLCLLVVLFGLLYGRESSDVLRAGGLAALAAGAGVALAQMWNWNAAVVRHGLAVLLVGLALLMAISYLPGVSVSDPYPHYKPLDVTVQNQLLAMGNSSAGAGGPLATIAPGEAVKFLSGREPAGNESQLLDWLAGPQSARAPYPSGTRIVVPISVFDSLSQPASGLSRNWTMEAFHFSGVANSSSGQLAVFDSYDGLRVVHPLDAQSGELAAQRTYLYSLSSGALVKVMMVGEVQLLEPGQPFDAPGNLLIWPNEELHSKLLGLYGDSPAGVKVVSRTTDALVLEVI
ncbi:Uncharacterised protein [uncultured archaeon]|nr:Uncharacterised protein [uncultured archaeon]